MAYFITRTADNIFFGSPIVFKVSAGTRPRSSSFHRVILDVSVSGPNGIVETPLSKPVPQDGATVEFDISSCLIAAHESYVYTPVSTNVEFPAYRVILSAHDEWVTQGDAVAGPDTDVLSSQTFVAGRYSDYERTTLSPLPTTHSRKPTAGELVFKGDHVIFSTSQGVSPRSSNLTVTAEPGRSISIGSRSAFVVPAERDSRQFQFVNSRGVIESIRAFGIADETMQTSHTESTYSVFERLTSLSRTYMRKQVKPSEFKLSSGFVSYEWARWWAYEFCAASQHWMLNDGHWIPVHISIADSTTIIDRTKTDLLHVDFTVTPDLNGAMW